MNPLLRARPHMLRALWGSGALFALVAAGAMMLHFTEGIDWLDCVYWCAPRPPPPLSPTYAYPQRTGL